MARTTAEAVQGILLQDYDADEAPSLTPFIDTAAIMVGRVIICATAKGLTLTAEELEIVERWLAAHYYVCSDQTYASASTNGASASFHGKTDMGLNSSRYGQTALGLDHTGCLAAINKGGYLLAPVWLGKTVAEQTPFNDR